MAGYLKVEHHLTAVIKESFLDTSYYRFEVSQRIAEMDKYGTKLFFEKYKTQEEFTTFENKLRDSQNKIDEDVANYVLGKRFKLKF